VSPVQAADHNSLHAVIGLGLATNLINGNTGHIAAHELAHLATDLGLPLDLTAGDPGHTDHSAALATWLAEATPGIRGGPAGQRVLSSIPGYPTSFTSSHATFASLQAAVNAAGTGRVFHVTGSFQMTGQITPHTDDEFWGDNGVTLSSNGSAFYGFFSTSAVTGVRIMNIKFTAFNDRAINLEGTNNGSEVGYCTFDMEEAAAPMGNYGTAGVHWVHHSLAKNFNITSFSSFQLVDAIIEDCEIGPVPTPTEGGVTKMVQTVRMRYRHNWIHDCLSTGAIWYDYKNWDSITEWNLVEDNTGPGTGIHFEANYQFNETQRNIVRYNLVRNNGGDGINITHSSYTDVYENVLENNHLAAGSGEMTMSILQDETNPQDTELKENYFHHNHVTPHQPVIGGGIGAARMYVAPVFVGAARDPYVTTNTKNNRWDYNAYHVVAPSTDTLWRWDVAINKTFAAWQTQTVPQDVNSTID
jgi:parallel beta-helix repeat protein